MTTLETMLVCVIAYIVVNMVITSLVMMSRNGGTMLVSDMWKGVFFCWLMLIIWFLEKKNGKTGRN